MRRNDHDCDIGTLASRITNKNEIIEPTVVKVHIDKTLKDNNLRVLKDGVILNSQACLLVSKKKTSRLGPFLNSLV